MLLGDILAHFQDEAVVSETLFSLHDLALTASVVARAAENNVTTGELAVESVGRFVDGATDDEWLTLIGQMSLRRRSGPVFLRRVLQLDVDTIGF